MSPSGRSRETRPLAGALFLLTALGTLHCGPGESSRTPGPEARSTSTSSRDVRIASSCASPPGPGNLAVTITIPQSHHGYLDEGDEGFFIPIDFEFADDAGAPVSLEPLERPDGRRDDEVGATVLRGDGRFLFAAEEDGVAASSTVRFQICSDITGVCYRPESVTSPLPDCRP